MQKSHSKVWKQLQALESSIFGYIKNAVEDAEVAKDLCQDVFIQALQKMDELNPEVSPHNWLKTVSRNRIINYYRERQRRTYVELSESTIRTELKTENWDQTVEHAIRQLPDDQRDILMLRELEGYSYRDLADHFQRSEAAVTSLLKRARISFTRFYLLNHLPDWFRKYSDDLSVEDIGRFINAFDPPLDLLDEIEAKSQHYFESIRQTWNKIHEHLFPKIYLDRIMDFLGSDKENRVLDLGCGSGVVSTRVAITGKHVIGVDKNKGMLYELVRIRNSMGLKNLQLVRGNITGLPFKKIYVNELFLTLVLHHVSDPHLLLQKAAGYLQKDGYLILVEFDRHTNRQLADTMHDLWLGFEPRLIERWCRKEGLIPVKTEMWTAGENVNAYYYIFQKQ